MLRIHSRICQPAASAVQAPKLAAASRYCRRARVDHSISNSAIEVHTHPHASVHEALLQLHERICLLPPVLRRPAEQPRLD